MSQEELYHSCVGKLYEMALEREGWEAFLDDLCTLTDASFAHYVARDERAGAIIFSASSRSNFTASKPTSSITAPEMPDGKLGTERIHGACSLHHRMFDERYFSHSGFYEDSINSVDCRYVAIADLGQVDGVKLNLRVQRGEDHDPFRSRELEWLDRIKPHLQRVARLQLEVWQLRFEASLAQDALNVLQYPVMVVDEEARVQLTNVAGERWLFENGEVASNSGCLRSSRELLHELLREAITAATRGNGGHRTASTLAVPRKRSFQNGGSNPYTARVMPLLTDAQPAGTLQRSLALLLFSDPEEPQGLEPGTLQTLFRLTPAEARLAIGVADGKSLEEIARGAHVSVNTAKTQLRLVFEKTGTHRQAELVKLVLSHPRLTAAQLSA